MQSQTQVFNEMMSEYLTKCGEIYPDMRLKFQLLLSFFQKAVGSMPASAATMFYDSLYPFAQSLEARDEQALLAAWKTIPMLDLIDINKLWASSNPQQKDFHFVYLQQLHYISYHVKFPLGLNQTLDTEKLSDMNEEAIEKVLQTVVSDITAQNPAAGAIISNFVEEMKNIQPQLNHLSPAEKCKFMENILLQRLSYQ